MSRALTIGTFDLTHAGHAAFLRQAAEYGDLTVGVNSDRFLMEEYGKRRPIFPEGERLRLVRAMGYEARRNDGPGRRLIESWQMGTPGRPNSYERNYLVISTDWMYPKDYLKQIELTVDELRYYNMHLVFVPHTPGVSTTEIIERVAAWQAIDG